MRNILEILRDAPDAGHNYIDEYTQITNSCDYFLELALFWSFKLHSPTELEKFFQNICSRLEYYFDSDLDEIFEKITNSILNSDDPLHLYTIEKLDKFIINLNKGRIIDKINNECERYDLDKNKELAKLFVLHYKLICAYFIALLNKDKQLKKQVGLFSPRVGIFKRQTPEEYLEALNNITRQRVELYTNYSALGKDESEIEAEIEKYLPFKSIVERILLYKALYSTKQSKIENTKIKINEFINQNVHPKDRYLVKDEDIIWQLGLSLVDIKELLDQDDVFRTGLFAKLIDSGHDNVSAAKVVLEDYPFYYIHPSQRGIMPMSETGEIIYSDDELRLPFCLKNRVNNLFSSASHDSSKKRLFNYYKSTSKSLNSMIRLMITDNNL